MPDRPPYKAGRLIFWAADSRRMWELGQKISRSEKEALEGRLMEPPRSFRPKHALLNRLRLETLQQPPPSPKYFGGNLLPSPEYFGKREELGPRRSPMLWWPRALRSVLKTVWMSWRRTVMQ